MDQLSPEELRLQALLGLEIMDTPPDPTLDAITRVAGQVAGTPISLVSLVDAERQWFKAKCGLEVDQTDRSVAFCDFVVRDRETLVVPDARDDDRFKDNPLVTGEPHVRFYAGVPLSGPDGSIIGTLCVIDHEPRSLTEEQLGQLHDLADVAMQQIVSLKQAIELERSGRQLRATNETLEIIQAAQNRLLSDGLDRGWWDSVLGQLLDLTESEYGFIGRVSEDDDGPFLKTEAITNIAWNEETRQFYEDNSPAGLVFRNMDTLFGRPITERALLIANEVATDARAGGRPEGHPPLNTFAGVPVWGRGREMIGLVGLANRKVGYSQELVDSLNPALTLISAVLENDQLSAQRAEVVADLRTSNEFLERVLAASVSGFVALDASGGLRFANGRAYELFKDLPESDESYSSLDDGLTRLLPRIEDRRWLLEVWSAASGEPESRRVSVLREDMQARWLEVSATAVSGPDGTSELLLLAAQDQSERDMLEVSRVENAALEARIEQLRRQQHINEVLFECVDHLQHSQSIVEGFKIIWLAATRLFESENVRLFRLDEAEDSYVEEHRILRWNESALGQSVDHLDQSCWALRSRRVHGWREGGHQLLCGHLESVTSGVTWCIPLMTLDRVVGMVQVVSDPADAAPHSEERFEASASQITAVAQTMSSALSTISLRESLQHLATMDPLTGIWNRRAFEDSARKTMARAQRKGEPVALAVADLDHFKKVNDDFGHDVGDEALQKVSTALSGSLRLGDFIGRLGGEEFGIFLSDVGDDGEGAEVALERALADVRNRCRVRDRDLTASIGFAVAQEGETYGDLYRRADEALYAAKNAGRDRIHRSGAVESQ